MANNTFATIYIGSYEVSLKVFELTSKKKLHELDHVRSRIDLGREVYQTGVLGYEKVDELCDTLLAFMRIAKGYRVSHIEVNASAVIRDASNELFILNQIQIRTGMEVKVQSNSEHRLVTYKSVAGRTVFEEMIQTSAAVVDLGGSGMQITLFRDGRLITTQHIDIGTLRLRAILGDRGLSMNKYMKEIEEFIYKKIEVFCSLYMKEGVDYCIILNDYAMELYKTVGKKEQEETLSAEKFIKYIEKLQAKTLEEISMELNLSNDRDPLVIPTIMVFKSIVQNLKGHRVWIPRVNVNDGIAYDYCERNQLIKGTHDFEADILSASHHLSEHFQSYSPHIKALTEMSEKIFDHMKKIHGLGRRERLLLQVATILHDCGKYISLANSPQCAYTIIMSSEILGLSHLEREIVALTVLYNHLALEDYDELSDRIDQDSYLVVAKLSAILRLANALDQSHKQKFDDFRISIKGKELIITVEAFEDISLEQALFETKTQYFESVFSMKPVLKEKRIFLPNK